MSPSGILCLCIELLKDLLCFPRVVLQDLEGFHRVWLDFNLLSWHFGVSSRFLQGFCMISKTFEEFSQFSGVSRSS